MTEIRVDDMAAAAQRFARDVVGLRIPGEPMCLGQERASWFRIAAHEELDEFQLANERGDVAGAVDALVDLAYFVLGRVVEMGVSPDEAFATVHIANMGKLRGELSKRPGSAGYDAVKPPGWVPPDWSWLGRGPSPATGDTMARKDHSGKPPLSLVPYEALAAEAEAFKFGVVKYSAWNHLSGRPWSDYIDAALRHVYAFASGQDYDPDPRIAEAGMMVHHVGSARACLAMLMCSTCLHPEFDNRRK